MPDAQPPPNPPQTSSTLGSLARGAYRYLAAEQRLLRGRLTGIDRRLTARYLAGQGVRKLHLGCGGHVLEGWLNSDFRPRSGDVLRLDAAGVFPFATGTFDYIFSEHMIEHIPYQSGCSMLRECHRVLKDGGAIRVTTPDLAFLVDLYRSDKTETQRRYIEWSSSNFIRGAPYHDAAFVINNFVRDWGHQFIYDEGTLRSSLERAGFSGITRGALNESAHEPLRNLENTSRMPEGFLELESLVLEGTKMPGGA